MATQLSQFTPSPMAVQYAYGLAQTMSQPVANFLAPTIEVDTMIGRYKKYDRKHAFHIPNTSRAIGGRATEVTWGAEDATYNCQPHAIDVPVDMLVQDEGSKLEDMVNEAADLAAEIGSLQHEQRVVDLAVATVGSSATVKPYKTTDPDDPIAIIDGYIKDVILAARYGSAMGVRVLFGATAWLYIKNCDSVRNRVITAGAGGNRGGRTGVPATAAPNVTVASISNLLFGEPETMLSLMVKDTSAENVTDVPAFVLDTSVLIFAARQTPTRRDPSFMKTFRPRGLWMVPGQYLRDDQRVTVAKFDWAADVQVTNSDAAKRIVLSNATS